MDKEFLIERISKTKALIEEYEDAALKIMSGGIESYMLDTGQSQQRITKINVQGLQNQIDRLYSRLDSLQSRLSSITGGCATIARPSW